MCVAWDGVCVWYGLWGTGWGMCVVWLGVGYVCGMACGAWDGVCVWYSLCGLGWGMCVVQLVGLGMGYVCSTAWDGVCVWYSLWGLGWGLCVVQLVGLGMGYACGLGCGITSGAWGRIYMLYRAGNGCSPFSCVLQRAVLCSHKTCFAVIQLVWWYVGMG